MSYAILMLPETKGELLAIPAKYRREIVDGIREKLTHEPTILSRNRKPLTPPLPYPYQDDLLWELRVGDYRVFYRVVEEESSVEVVAIRVKRPDQTTKDILS